MLAEGNVKVIDKEENILLSKKASYDKINGLIITYENTELVLKEWLQTFYQKMFTIILIKKY